MHNIIITDFAVSKQKYEAMFCVPQMICKRNSLITCLQTQKEFQQRLIEGKAISTRENNWEKENWLKNVKEILNIDVVLPLIAWVSFFLFKRLLISLFDGKVSITFSFVS